MLKYKRWCAIIHNPTKTPYRATSNLLYTKNKQAAPSKLTLKKLQIIKKIDYNVKRHANQRCILMTQSYSEILGKTLPHAPSPHVTGGTFKTVKVDIECDNYFML